MAQQSQSAPAEVPPATTSVPASTQSKTAAVKPDLKPDRAEKTERQDLPPFNVILLNDEEHTFEYVIEMLKRLFGHSDQMANQIAQTVDHQGRAIVMTTHKERAEFKRDQIRGFGSDPRVASCHCSMGAVIESAK